jgi:predicted nucleic acid-binding protein
MILVDTSVLINYLKGSHDAKTQLFDSVLSGDIPYGISSYTYQELLQGARNEKEFVTLKEYLGSQKIYFLPEAAETYENAARVYFNLRRKGITPRGTIDILIACTAMRYRLALLHNDHDFDVMATVVPDLKILDTLFLPGLTPE